MRMLVWLIMASQCCEIAQSTEDAWGEGGQAVVTEVSAGGEAYAVQMCIWVVMYIYTVKIELPY